MNDIKSLINKIIEDTPNENCCNTYKNNSECSGFDQKDCKNKLSMLVLKDLIHGMMRDEPIEDLDNMIGQSLGKYLNDPAFKNVDAYDYICRSRDRLNSPMLGELIQELEQATEELNNKSKQGEKIDVDNYNIKDILNNVENYDELRNILKEIVSKKVVRDVTKTIIKSNDAPTFDGLDEKLAQTSDDTTQESILLTISGQIFKESYHLDPHSDPDVAMQRAIVEYCVHQLSRTFKQYPQVTIFKEYGISPTDDQLYQEVYYSNKWAIPFVNALIQVKNKDDYMDWFKKLNNEFRSREINNPANRKRDLKQIITTSKNKVFSDKKHWLHKINIDLFIDGDYQNAKSFS